VVEGDPSDAQAHRRLGVALRRSGQIDEAFEHLEQATRLAPDDPGILLSLGTAYSGERRPGEAQTTYLRLLEVAPDHAVAMNNLGNLALRRGDETAAIDWYRRAAEADPQYLLARHRLAEQLKYHGRFDEAYPEYERILEMQPKDARERIAQVESLYAMGAISLAREDFELAERQLSRVVQNVPNHRSAHWSRAQALIQLDRQDEAQQELEVHMRIRHSMGQGF